jgi:hypothetical protein
VIGNAVKIMRIATGEETETYTGGASSCSPLQPSHFSV